MLNQRVLFQTDIGSFGEGIVVAFDEDRELVTVLDDHSRRNWTGSIDRIEFLEQT